MTIIVGCGSNKQARKGQSVAELKRNYANDIKAISTYNDIGIYKDSLRVSRKWCKWCNSKKGTTPKELAGECQRMCQIESDLRSALRSGSKVDVLAKRKEDRFNNFKSRAKNYCQDLSENLFTLEDRERFIRNCHGTKSYQRIYGK